MDTIPPEILAQIISFACTDEGSTGRAVSLVSRHFHDVGEPYLLQSVAVAGHAQLHALRKQLEARPPHLRRVRFLFMSDWTREQTRMAADGASLPSNEEDLDRYDQEKEAAQRVLALVAPSLVELTILAQNPLTSTAHCARVFATPFPCLAELTLSGLYPFPAAPAQATPPARGCSSICSDFEKLSCNSGSKSTIDPACSITTPGSSDDARASLVTLPSLERLHLRGNRNPHGLLQLGALGAACPSLTHLRISGITGAAWFARELDEAYTARCAGADSASGSVTAFAGPSSTSMQDAPGLSFLNPPGVVGLFPSRLPPRLRMLIAQPGPEPPTVQRSRRGVAQRSSKMDLYMMDCLQELEQKALGESEIDTSSTSFILLDRPAEGEDPFLVAKTEWLDRLNGKDGDWAKTVRHCL